jgi:hypothetical protein
VTAATLAASCLVLLAAPRAPQESAPPKVVPPNGAATGQATAAEEFARQLAGEGIELDRPHREVRVRGAVLRLRQSPDYPIEYALVTNEGSKHEAFGLLRCTPSLLNACFLALGLEPGQPRRRVARDPMPSEADLEAGIEEPFRVLAPEGTRVFIYVRWSEGGKSSVRAFEDLFLDLRDGKPLPMRGYVYLGSRFVEIEERGVKRRVYVADYEGNIIAIHSDAARDAASGRAVSDCLFDADSKDDEPYAWSDVDESKLPSEPVPVEFIFALDPRPDCRPYEPEVEPAAIAIPSARELAKRTRNPVWDEANAPWLDRLGTRSLQELCAILKRTRQPLTETVAVLLGATKRDEAVDTLSLVLRFGRSPDARLAASYGLAEIGSDKAVLALIGALDAGNSAVVDDALTGLRLLSGRDCGRRPLPWREWLRSRGTPR